MTDFAIVHKPMRIYADPAERASGSGDAHGLSLSTNPTSFFSVAGTGDAVFILPFNVGIETAGDAIRSTTTLASGNLGAGSVPIGAAGVVPVGLAGIWEVSGQCATSVGGFDVSRQELHIALCRNAELLYTAAHRASVGVLDSGGNWELMDPYGIILTASVTPYWIVLDEGDYIYMAVAAISGTDLISHDPSWAKLTMKFVGPAPS